MKLDGFYTTQLTCSAVERSFLLRSAKQLQLLSPSVHAWLELPHIIRWVYEVFVRIRIHNWYIVSKHYRALQLRIIYCGFDRAQSTCGYKSESHVGLGGTTIPPSFGFGRSQWTQRWLHTYKTLTAARF